MFVGGGGIVTDQGEELEVIHTYVAAQSMQDNNKVPTTSTSDFITFILQLSQLMFIQQLNQLIILHTFV